MNYISINKIKYEIYNDTHSNRCFIIQDGKKRFINKVFAYKRFRNTKTGEF